MTQRYTIGLAAEHHVRAIPAIEQAAAAMFSETDLPAQLRYLVTDVELIVEAQRQGRLWAALDEKKKLVGFALVRMVGRFAHLEEMDVHPDHARQGLGTRLLGAVIAWAKDGGHPGISLITFRHLPWNAPFYERNGFVQLADGHDHTYLRDLIGEEAGAGIDPSTRVAMLYDIFGTPSSA